MQLIEIFDWLGQLFCLIPKNSKPWRLKIYVGMNDDVLVSILNLEISAASESLVYWWVQRCCSASVISSRSGDLGLLEYWIWPYVRGHCFGCSLRPGALQYSPWKLASYVLSWSLILPIRSNDWVVVAGLVLVHLKPIPESPTKI